MEDTCSALSHCLIVTKFPDRPYELREFGNDVRYYNEKNRQVTYEEVFPEYRINFYENAFKRFD